MVRPRGEINVICQNEKCKYYLKEESKDIIKRGKYNTGHQRYYCNHCKTFFMETKGTPLFHKHLTKPEIINICKHLVEKNGIRSIERITGHHRDTIGDLIEDLALHAEFVNSILLQDIKLGQFEVDEMWTFVKKKQKNIEPGSPNSDIEGDAWLFSFITRGSYLIVAYEIGKRTRESCKRLFEKVFDRVQLPFPDVKIQIFSDGNDDYTSTIPEYYAETCVDYGQLIKIREGGKVVDKIKKVIYGTPSIDEIETTDIENMNGICRERLGRFVRKTKCFSKKKTRLVNAFELFHFYWNFIDKLTKTETPAMMEGLADHQWNWDQFFNVSLSILN